MLLGLELSELLSKEWSLLGRKNSKESSDTYSPLRSKRQLGGRNLANWPLAEGVDILSLWVDIGTGITALDSASELLEDVLVVEEYPKARFCSTSMSAKQLVVVQNRKLPKMLPIQRRMWSQMDETGCLNISGHF